MSRGKSSGGGKSSLDYLFESDQNLFSTKGTKRLAPPPFAIDFDGKTGDDGTNAITFGSAPSNSFINQDQKLGKATRGRPSVKVQSVPGGSSSLSYLFGDK